MAPRGHIRERGTRKRGITIGRRVGKIGFMGRGVSPPSHEKPDVVHALSLRIDESLIMEGERERERCRYDELPWRGLLRKVFSSKPLAVVFPDSGQCVADILDVCIEERTPAVPRGLGSTGLGGATPLGSWVVIDLSRMTKVVTVDREASKVTVQPGCTWERLQETVYSEDLSLRSYPSNRAGATVGGWLSAGGYGVGTLAGGRFDGILDSLEVAVPSGLLVNAVHGSGRYSIESFAGTEGQLGIVTGLTFSLKRIPELRAYYVMGPLAMKKAETALRDLAHLDNPPFGMRLLCTGFARLLGGAGQAPKDGSLLAVLFEGSETEVGSFDKCLEGLSMRLDAEIRRGESARSVFDSHFTDFAKDGTKAVARTGEALVPIERLGEFIAVLEREQGGDVLCDCQAVGPDVVLVMAGRAVDGRGLPRVVRDVPLTVGTSLAALRCGGKPYGLGIWNSPFSKGILGRARKDLQAIKNDTDRLKILNPGKFFSLTTGTGLPIWAWSYKVGLRMIGSLGEGGVR